MGRATAFCAKSGEFWLQVKIPQTTPQTTGGLTLLFVIQKAAIATDGGFTKRGLVLMERVT